MASTPTNDNTSGPGSDNSDKFRDVDDGDEGDGGPAGAPNVEGNQAIVSISDSESSQEEQKGIWAPTAQELESLGAFAVYFYKTEHLIHDALNTETGDDDEKTLRAKAIIKIQTLKSQLQRAVWIFERRLRNMRNMCEAARATSPEVMASFESFMEGFHVQTQKLRQQYHALHGLQVKIEAISARLG
ncbi:MAG: hypothetical protein Q9168_007544 [Polycauliona sp. 1 TL-2023]